MKVLLDFLSTFVFGVFLFFCLSTVRKSLKSLTSSLGTKTKHKAQGKGNLFKSIIK